LFQFVVVIYNPIGRESSHMTRIPVSGNSYVVKDANQMSVDAQVCDSSFKLLFLLVGYK